MSGGALIAQTFSEGVHMYRLTFILALAAAPLTGEGSASGQVGLPAHLAQSNTNVGAGRLFERLDRNGDGVVTTEEISATRAAAFDAADLDHDGYLTSAEARSLRGQAGVTMGRVDADGDGRVSREEFGEGGGRVMRMDLDGDGRVTRSEFGTAMERLRARQR